MISKENKSNPWRVAFYVCATLVFLGFIYLLISRSQSSSPLEQALAPKTELHEPKTPLESPEPSAAVPPTLSADEVRAAAQIRVLDQILASRNDNDPRMDTELKVLSETAKQRLRQKYDALAAERRNDRGTIVFLLGRNLQTSSDYQFMKKVLLEEPCLSLTDCSKEPGRGADRDSEDHQNGVAVSLAYPQLVALRAMDRAFQGASGDDAALKTQIIDVLDAGKRSKVREVSKTADNIEAKITR